MKSLYKNDVTKQYQAMNQTMNSFVEPLSGVKLDDKFSPTAVGSPNRSAAYRLAVSQRRRA